jgi:tetratricopeptide (TPR) repeat protein
MRPKFRILIPIIAFAFWSCVAAQSNPKTPSGAGGAAGLFSIAENLFQSNSYENALEAYQEFLSCNSSDSNADTALMRIATIYSNQKKHGLSQVTYQRLIDEHPQSELALDAMIEIMMSFFSENQFKKVIAQASIVIEKTDSRIHLSRTYEVLGDTYMSLKSPKEAILFYQMANLSKEETVPFKLKDAANQLSEEDRLSLSGKLNDLQIFPTTKRGGKHWNWFIKLMRNLFSSGA